ncbi:MAG: hypothetical protein PHI71_15660 [Acidiphilium sp.]|jgi:hypothetical protein|uniref:Lipoprotein n=1 Tax=Acidiphilium acidophilum TaxID=76588 RepID=A0AAW9DLY4_ACIAO|nr:hypothetical protein [Acidiphilium acidophilum]MDD2862484.1 hypothetical protein [Acidiphilium sp.]MDX5930058.1 hypothetical protein [Acidiphilium acidophilum]MEE3503304.1 hypothetical protein [Acidiphilium acidophilum]
MQIRTMRLGAIAGMVVLGASLAGCSGSPPTRTTTTTEETSTRPVMVAPQGAPATVTTTHSETEQVNQ